MNSASEKLQRDQYGALNFHLMLSQELQIQVAEFLSIAVKNGYLPEPFINGNDKEYECLNLDVYDILTFRKKIKYLVVQVRTFWKNVRKNHSRSGKNYYLVTRTGKKITTHPIEKATCVKRAKNTTELGQLAKHYLGQANIACKKPDVSVSTAYKILAKTDDGRLVSAYDGSEYITGKWRSQTAKPNHDGGFYYYLDSILAIDATRLGNTFVHSVSTGKKLVLCQVAISGRKIEYSCGKWAASRLRVVKELMAVSID
jgi:hypothetical protein